MDALKFKDLLLELIEELKIARITVVENEGRIQQLVKECHDKERKLEEEAIKTQSLKDKHEETETILSKASDDKINHLEAEKTKLHLAGESLEKEMKALKDEVRTLQLSKYNLERTVREQQHRLHTQGQAKTSHSEQVVDIENKCKHLQKEMASYSDTLNVLKKEVEEAGVLNRTLASTNSHQKCQISSLRDEIERQQRDIIKLRVHGTERPDDAANQEKMELKIGQLQKELKQAAQINQELRNQLGETKLAHQVTQSQLQESQDLAERCMACSKEMTEQVAHKETQVASLTKECAALSEQRTEANTEANGLRKEMAEWEVKKKAEMLVLEEEVENAKTECSISKKAVLNLEDINASWASKNHVLTNDIQCLKMELDSQSAELEKLKIPICNFDKDTQTHSCTNNDSRYARTSRAGEEECPAILASEKSVDGSGKDEEIQVEDGEARGRQLENSDNRETPWVEGQAARNLSSGESDNRLHQAKAAKAILHFPFSGTAGASSQKGNVDTSKDGGTVQAELEMEGQNTKELSSQNCKDRTPYCSSPVKETVILDQIPKSKDGDSNQIENENVQKPKELSSENNRDNAPATENLQLPLKPTAIVQIRELMNCEDGKQGVPTGEEDIHHQIQSTNDAVALPIPGHSSEGVCLDPEKNTPTKVATPGQSATEFDSTKTSLNTISLDRFHGSLEASSNINCPVSYEESRGTQLVAPEISNISPSKEGTSPPRLDKTTLLKKFIHDKPVDCVSAAEGVASHCVAVTVFGNSDRAEVSDEDIVIPSTYAEENSTRFRGDEYVKIQECDTTRCDQHDSMADKLPVTVGIIKGQTGLSVSSKCQEGLNNNFTESAKVLPVLLPTLENKSGDDKSDRTTKSASTEKISVAEAADTETVSEEKDSSQYTRRLRSFSSTDGEDIRLAATYLRGSYNSLIRKGQCTSLTTEPSYLQTPKRKYNPVSHQVTSPRLVPKTATLVPDNTSAFSCFANSEPLSVRSINSLQKSCSLAKTKFTWSSPIMQKGTELTNAMSYSSWKASDPHVHTQHQHEEGKATTQAPAMFSHLPSSAQQLRQSLYPSTPSTASEKIQDVHSISTSISTLGQQSTHPTESVVLSPGQDTVPRTSITLPKDTRGVMPRLTHGRSFIDRSSEKDEQKKTSSNTKSVPDTNPTSPGHVPVLINLPCWLPSGMDQADPVHGGGDAGGEASLFSDDEADEDMKDGVASQIDRIQTFLKKDRLKRAKLE